MQKTTDKLVKQNRRILELETAKDRDVTNLKNWLDDTGCISREETKYLTQQSDLMALGSFETDGAVSGLEEPLEDAVIWASRKLGKVTPPPYFCSWFKVTKKCALERAIRRLSGS